MEQRLGHYRLIDVIASGGMGQLHLAARIGPEGVTKIAALKCILPELAETTLFRQRFLNEAWVAAQLDHPNIVHTFELGEADGAYFIAMEYLPGEDLAAIAERTQQLGRRMPVEIAIAIAAACAEGLHFAHELPGKDGRPSGLVHRDVNPTNILVTYHGAVKLLDFGIAKVRDSSVQSRSGNFHGKLRYAAPEQIESAPLDRRTDVFGLGVVLWECLTGTPLFDGIAQAQVVEAIRSKPIVAPSELRGGIPPELDQVVLKALAREPRRRYQSARELAIDLARFSFPQVRIAEWLKSLFGEERAAQKIGIARGHRPPSRTGSLPPRQPATTPSGFKRAWTSDLPGRAPFPTVDLSAVTPAPFLTIAPPVPRERSRRFVWLTIPLLLGFGGAAAMVGAPSQELAPPAPARAIHSLEVSSDPPGAQIYLDGQPVGRRTPAQIEEVRGDGVIEVKLVFPGYQTAKMSCLPGAPCSMRLARSTATLEISGLPRAARIFVDGNEIEASPHIELPVGYPRLRVEANDRLVFDGTVQVTAEGAHLALQKRR